MNNEKKKAVSLKFNNNLLNKLYSFKRFILRFLFTDFLLGNEWIWLECPQNLKIKFLSYKKKSLKE